MEYLVGYTGFVGSNLAEAHEFGGKYNSKNIKEAYEGMPDLLVYSGVPAQMFLANTNPEADAALMDEAIENIKRIKPKKLVLISTIAVYPDAVKVDEDSVIDMEKSLPYGANRRYLEKWVEDNMEEYLIVRLPAIYGLNLKKNFIYDFIHYIPALLNESKYAELSAKESMIGECYSKQDNGFYKCRELTGTERTALVDCFKRVGFSALNFTDSRSQYQFYNLKWLWKDIETALKEGIKKLNIAIEPVSVSELYTYLTGESFVNELDRPVYKYDFRTKHCGLFGGSDGYIRTRNECLEDIKTFVRNMTEGL